MILMRITGEGRAERNHGPNPIGMLASNFTCEQSAEAPAYEQHPRSFANLVEMIAQPIDRVVTNTAVPPHAPTVNPPTCSSERLAKRHGRPVGRKETWNHHCRRPIGRSHWPTRAESIDDASNIPAQLDQTSSTRRQSVVTSEMIAYRTGRAAVRDTLFPPLAPALLPAASLGHPPSDDSRARARGSAARRALYCSACARSAPCHRCRDNEGSSAAPASREASSSCESRDILPRIGTQLSMSFMRYLPRPMSPVEVSITW